MHNPKISLITVCFNVEDTINSTLESVLNQSYKNIEYIIIDGGSKDKTISIINSHKIRNLKLISEPDKGIYDAMNKALGQVSGDLVFFINSGDRFYDNQVLENIRKLYNKDLDIIIGDVQVTKNGNNAFIKSHKGMSDEYLMNNGICHQGIFFRAEFIKRYKFNLNYKVGADFDMFLQMVVKDKGKFKYIERLIAFYPLGGLSSPDDPNKIDKIKQEFNIILKKNFGLKRFLQHTYKAGGIKAVLKELLGKNYSRLAIIFKFLYYICIKISVNLTSGVINIYYYFKKKERNSVLIVAELDRFGGTRTFIFQLIEFYLTNGYKPIVALEEPYIDDDLVAYLKDKEVTLYRLANRYNFLGPLKRFKLLKDLLYELVHIGRLILQNHPQFLTISVGTQGLYLGLLKLGTKNLYYLHTYPGHDTSDISKWLLNSSLSKKNRLLTVSQSSLDKTIKGFTIKNAQYAEFIYNNTGSQKDKIEERNSFGKKTVLTIGHVNDYKDPLLWVEIAKKVISLMQNVNFVWVGDGQQIEEVKELSKDFTNILFVGSVGHDKIKDYLKNCDVYLQPSLMESFGLSVVEAMKYSKPVIVAAVGGLNEVVTDDTGYKIESRDPQEYAKKIIELLNNQDLIDKLGSNSRKRFEQNFTVEIWAAKLLKMHASL